MSDVSQNTLRSLLKGTIALLIVFLVLYAAAAAWLGYNTRAGHDTGPANPQYAADARQADARDNEYKVRVMAAESVVAGFNKVAVAAWEFVRPLLQLLIVLVIIDWVLRRVGIQLGASVQSFRWDVQAIIAIIVIVAYALSELGGLGGGGMKDIALVVVGFYFGTQRHAYELDPETGKMRVIHEHENTIEGGKAGSKVEPAGSGSQN